MNKQEFLEHLEKRLPGLPQDEAEERLTFYSEMIDDRMEEGLTEEDSVAQIGSVESVAAQILSETVSSDPAKEQASPQRRLRGWEIALLTLGSPLWLALIIAAFAVAVSMFAVIWCLVITLWAVEVSVAAGALVGIFSSALFAVQRNFWPGAAMLGAGFVCAGLSILLFFGCGQAAKGAALLTRKAFRVMKLGTGRRNMRNE